MTHDRPLSMTHDRPLSMTPLSWDPLDHLWKEDNSSTHSPPLQRKNNGEKLGEKRKNVPDTSGSKKPKKLQKKTVFQAVTGRNNMSPEEIQDAKKKIESTLKDGGGVSLVEIWESCGLTTYESGPKHQTIADRYPCLNDPRTVAELGEDYSALEGGRCRDTYARLEEEKKGTREGALYGLKRKLSSNSRLPYFLDFLGELTQVQVTDASVPPLLTQSHASSLQTPEGVVPGR